MLKLDKLLEKTIARAMRSEEAGVIGRLRRTIPHLLSTHCVNQKLALGLNDSLKENPDLEKIYDLVYGITPYLADSPKRMNILRDVEPDERQFLYPIVPFAVRWYSLVPSLDRFLSIIGEIIDSLKEYGVPTALNYAKKIAKLKFIARACVTYDLFRIIEKTNKLLQFSDVTLCKLLTYIRSDLSLITTN